MRTILALLVLLVLGGTGYAQSPTFSVDAFVTGSGGTGGGIFASPVPANTVRVGWGAPGPIFRVHLIRLNNLQNAALDIKQTFIPAATDHKCTFAGVSAGNYVVGLEVTPGKILAASWPVEVK